MSWLRLCDHPEQILNEFPCPATSLPSNLFTCRYSAPASPIIINYANQGLKSDTKNQQLTGVKHAIP